jgi:NTP pyrophosphatase (non-canonical NTP hydrolase)
MSKETYDQSIVARSQAINARSIVRVDRIRRSFAEARLAPRILAMCKRRGWSLHWSARGAYLHLEASELIEAIRGKRGDPKSEAADVLLVLMSITEANGISWSDVVAQATATCARLETCDPYPGEERQEHECATSQTPHTRSTLFRMPAQITFYTLFTAFQTLLLCWEIAVALDLLPN